MFWSILGLGSVVNQSGVMANSISFWATINSKHQTVR